MGLETFASIGKKEAANPEVINQAMRRRSSQSARTWIS
jgi:hypothetical protein